jgi:hypothetical protein
MREGAKKGKTKHQQHRCFAFHAWFLFFFSIALRALLIAYPEYALSWIVIPYQLLYVFFSSQHYNLFTITMFSLFFFSSLSSSLRCCMIPLVQWKDSEQRRTAAPVSAVSAFQFPAVFSTSEQKKREAREYCFLQEAVPLFNTVLFSGVSFNPSFFPSALWFRDGGLRWREVRHTSLNNTVLLAPQCTGGLFDVVSFLSGLRWNRDTNRMLEENVEPQTDGTVGVTNRPVNNNDKKNISDEVTWLLSLAGILNCRVFMRLLLTTEAIFFFHNS